MWIFSENPKGKIYEEILKNVAHESFAWFGNYTEEEIN